MKNIPIGLLRFTIPHSLNLSILWSSIYILCWHQAFLKAMYCIYMLRKRLSYTAMPQCFQQSIPNQISLIKNQCACVYELQHVPQKLTANAMIRIWNLEFIETFLPKTGNQKNQGYKQLTSSWISCFRSRMVDNVSANSKSSWRHTSW